MQKVVSAAPAGEKLVVGVICSTTHIKGPVQVGLPSSAYLRRAPLNVRPESVARFFMMRGRSARQQLGTTPFSASGGPTRCTKDHSSSNSLMSRRVSPTCKPSSSERLGSNEVVTCMSRGNDFGVNMVAMPVRGAEEGVLAANWKDAERGLGLPREPKVASFAQRAEGERSPSGGA